MGDNWKHHHAEESERALDHDLVRSVIDELLDNLGRQHDSLARYGVEKVASYAAQVARAYALGFDPGLLRMTDDESDAEALRKARLASSSGRPVWVLGDGTWVILEAGDDEPVDGATRIEEKHDE